MSLPDTFECSTAATGSNLAAATLAAAGSQRAVAASRAGAALANSARALRAARRPEPALAGASRTLSGSAAPELLSTLLGPAAEGLTRCGPGAVRSAIELLLGGLVAVLSTLPVLGVVLPRGPVAAGPTASVATERVHPIAAVDVPVEVVVAVHVDVDVAATPVAVTPIAPPMIIPAPNAIAAVAK